MERFQFQQFNGMAIPTETASRDLLRDVELDVTIDLGRAYLHREDMLAIEQGAIVPLDKAADEPVDVFAGGRLIARGEIVVLDEKFCVRIVELVAGAATV